MAVATVKKFGRFILPTKFYVGPLLANAELRHIVARYRPKNAFGEAQIATLARVAATLQDPSTGEPLSATSVSGIFRKDVGAPASIVNNGDCAFDGFHLHVKHSGTVKKFAFFT